jgi:hypothetical protein
VDSVLIAVGAELFQLNAPGGVATVFLGGVPRNSRRPLAWVCAALGAFQGNDNTDAFSHDSRPALDNERHNLLLFHGKPKYGKFSF